MVAYICTAGLDVSVSAQLVLRLTVFLTPNTVTFLNSVPAANILMVLFCKYCPRARQL